MGLNSYFLHIVQNSWQTNDTAVAAHLLPALGSQVTVCL